MKIVVGKNLPEITKEEFLERVSHYEKVEVDLGTGDGKFVYRNAKQGPQTFFIGIDPNQKQLELHSKKARKDKLRNILFVLGSVEHLPSDLDGIADVLHIILPWGTLLQIIASPNENSLKEIISLTKAGGKMKIVLGYAQELEPIETARLALEELDEGYISERIVPSFERLGMRLTSLRKITSEELKNFETTWSKKLGFGRRRSLYLLELVNGTSKYCVTI